MSNKMRSILSLLLILFTLLTTAQSLAQDGRTTRANEREFTGSVEAITMATITVDGHVISIVRAEMNDPIRVGSIVKVHYTVARNGLWIAREVGLADADDIDDDVDDGAVDDDHGDDIDDVDDGAVDDDHGHDGSDDGSGHDGSDDHGGEDHSGSDDHSGHGGD